MSRAYDDSRYLARTLVATLLDLDAHDQASVLAYFRDELKRLGIGDGSAPEAQEESPESNERKAQEVAGEPPPEDHGFSVYIIGDAGHRSRYSPAIGSTDTRDDRAALMMTGPLDLSDLERM